MPTFVVHQPGKDPESRFVEGDELPIGRDPKSALVLRNASVSRRHALVERGEGDTYSIAPVKDSNEVIVNGKEIGGPTVIEEGAQIQIAEFYVVFSKQAEAPEGYLVEGGFEYDAECDDCGFAQPVSPLSDAPSCERCGCSTLVRSSDRQNQATARESSQVGAANKSLLQRLVGGGPKGESFALHQDQPCTLGKNGRATISIEGFMIGTPAEICWEDGAYTVQKTGFFPGIKLNGESTRWAQLQHGDEIRIGANAFRFVVE